MNDLIWIIPAFPLLGFLTLLIAGRKLGDPWAGWLATSMIGGAFVAATVAVFAGLLGLDPVERVYEYSLFEWIPSGELSVGMGFLADPLSVTMALFITGIGALIHLYAIGYMHGDRDYSKFFLYLNLFIFSMLMLVLGDNLLITFLGWEGVGACSYFLISFWHDDPANATAGKKAFVTNRVGDWGFMLAMFLLFFSVGSLKYSDIFLSVIDDHAIASSTATAIVVLLFVGAAGKSAQFPLYLWLPDAMAGPTPVSALIHAATMVTSGVYLLTRMNPVIAAGADWPTHLITIVGLITALFAASIAVAQNDIKKVLAYSTVSQLGFMFVAVGSGLYVAAIFHMITHAFFKALLFLGAGSVIHGNHHNQDMRFYGAMRKMMPITAGTMMVGWLAISGVPPFSGFWSKDEVLLAAYNNSPVYWVLLLIAAIMTAFYMSRLVFMTFFGDARWAGSLPQSSADVSSADAPREDAHGEDAHGEDAHGEDAHGEDAGRGHTPHESPWLMWLPLVALAGLALAGGALNLPFSHDTKLLENWLHPVLFGNEAEIAASTGTKIVLAVIAVIGGLVGIVGAAAVYLRKKVDPALVEQPILASGWFYDTAVSDFMGGPGRKFFDAVAWFDRTIIDGAVNGAAKVSTLAGTRLRATQTGLVRSYALGTVVGSVVLITYFVARTSF